jgi:hypothetical protein
MIFAVVRRKGLVPHRNGALASPLATAALVAVVAFALPNAGRAEGLKEAPLAGIVKAGTAPAAGIQLLVHGLSTPIASFSRIVRTAADGTWVIPAAPVGLYAISSLASGFLPAVARVWHRADTVDVSFVTLSLERRGGVLPASPLGASDPWIARAVTAGDVLRDEGPSTLAPAPPPAAVVSGPRIAAADLRLPFRTSMQSTAGFGAGDGASISAASLGMAGILGSSTSWGLEGQYRRLGGEDGSLGNASRLSIDVAPPDQAFHVSARSQCMGPSGGEDPARFETQAIDWSAATGARSRASVTAQLVSETNLLQRGPVAELFARASNAFEVEARYRTEYAEGSFVRVAVGYRSSSGVDVPTTVLAALDRGTHLGGTAGIQLTRALSVEAGATGDVSNLVRGIVPELAIAVRTEDGIRIYGFVSRRFEKRLEMELPLARAGTDEAGLSRLSRALYRAGIRWDDTAGSSFAVEASQRELLGTYRLLLDPEFFDNLDSLYFLDGDVARELSGSTTFRISDGLQGRLTARAGQMAGERSGTIARDNAHWEVGQFAVRVGATGTWLGFGYRSVAQELDRSSVALRNELEAFDFTLAQTLPIPVLNALGTEWRALFSVELGNRREGEQVASMNRRFSGGLALNF